MIRDKMVDINIQGTLRQIKVINIAFNIGLNF